MSIDTMLFQRAGALGDVLMMSPIVHHYCELNPSQLVYVDTRHFEVFNNFPHIRKYDPAIKPKDVINLNGIYEKNLSVHPCVSYWKFSFAFTHAVDTEKLRMRLQCLPQDIEYSNSRREEFKLGAYIVLHFGASWVKVQESVIHDVCREVLSLGFTPVIIGGKNDRYSPLAVDARGKFSMHQLACFISCAQCYIGTDTGPLHIAGTTNVPIVGIFGFVDPKTRAPYRDDRCRFVSVGGDMSVCGIPPCGEKNKILAANGDFGGVRCAFNHHCTTTSKSVDIINAMNSVL